MSASVFCQEYNIIEREGEYPTPVYPSGKLGGGGEGIYILHSFLWVLKKLTIYTSTTPFIKDILPSQWMSYL